VSAPLLIVGHGTRDAAGVAGFLDFVKRLQSRLPVDVEGGFIELSRPPLTDAVTALWDAGHRHVVALPLVLVAAGHGKGDVPGALNRERERRPGLTYRYGRPLGPHPTLLSLVEERVDTALTQDDGTSAPREGTTVVLVGRGSTDPDANAEVCKVARLLQEGRPYAFVEPAFVSLTLPDVEGGLARCRALGARRVVVAPYFLFDGVLPRRVGDQARAFGAAHPDLDVLVAGHLGDSDALADLVVERYRETLSGDIRMNCDTCAYRVLLPGFEDKLGAPQTPHHHPEDPAHGHGHEHGHGHAHA